MGSLPRPDAHISSSNYNSYAPNNHNNTHNNNTSSYFAPHNGHGAILPGIDSSAMDSAASSSAHPHHRPQHAAAAGASSSSGPGVNDPSFDILDWWPAFLSCQRYFLDHAQFEPGTQAVCALINIRLPFQWLSHPVTASTTANNNPAAPSFPFNPYSPRSRDQQPGSIHPANPTNNSNTTTHISPIPYIRRLVVTGFDKPPILHGFFGDDFARGILPHVECERRNYLFAAKHGGWRSCKIQYDVGSGYGGHGDETVPFMKPLDEARGEELGAAEKQWSEWLAMEDWMVGPRAPGVQEGQQQEQQHQRRTRASQGGSAGTGTGLIGHSTGLPDGLPDGIRENYRER